MSTEYTFTIIHCSKEEMEQSLRDILSKSAIPLWLLFSPHMPELISLPDGARLIWNDDIAREGDIL